MFGYVVANSDILTAQEKERYKSIYCGLCRALEQRHGVLGRFTLTYDMTFLVLVLGSLYEPQTGCGCERCLPHPFKRHPYCSSAITDYAADMNVALTYRKLLDDWHDDKNIFKLFYAKLLKKKYQKIAVRYPRQCLAMDGCLKKLSEFEKSGQQNPDTGAQLFGQLMAELFVLYEDRWAPSLRAMAQELGEFIYIMDAVTDLEQDEKKGCFNPLSGLKKAGRNEEYFLQILTMLIGNCTMEFEKLPLVADVSIMRNILCSGVWTRYQFEKAKKDKRARLKGDKRQ